jgi:predicted nucleic acid-binding protein
MTSPAALPPVVCDTDAASFVVKDDPLRGPRYRSHLDGRAVFLPFCVVAELRFGSDVRNWSASRKARMDEFIRHCTVYYPDDRMCSLWAQVVASLRRVGRQIAPHDGWIAVTALYLDAPPVTHNAVHYQSVPGLQIITEPDT